MVADGERMAVAIEKENRSSFGGKKYGHSTRGHHGYNNIDGR